MSFLIAAVGITGLLVASSRPHIGWWFNLAAQPLWVYYAVDLQQWGLVALNAVYTVAYVRLLRKALRDRRAAQVTAERSPAAEVPALPAQTQPA